MARQLSLGLLLHLNVIKMPPSRVNGMAAMPVLRVVPAPLSVRQVVKVVTNAGKDRTSIVENGVLLKEKPKHAKSQNIYMLYRNSSDNR